MGGDLVSKSHPTLATPCTLDHRSLSLWDFPGRKTGVSCHFFLQEIFQTQGSNPDLLDRMLILYGLSHQGVTGLFDNKLRLCSNCKISVTMSAILSHDKCSVKDIVWSSTGRRGWAKTIVGLFVCLFVTFWLQGMWDLSSPTSDQTHASCGGSTVLVTGPPGKSQRQTFFMITLELS